MTTIHSYGQTITKEDFKTVTGATFSIIKHIEKSNVDDLKLSDSESETLKAQIKNAIPNTSIYTLPHFYLTERSNTFKMVIICFEIIKKENEDFNRGNYYFVIKSTVNINPESTVVSFYDSKVYTTSEDINTWWLSQCKDYLSETKKVYEKFDFVPPPPPLPPIDLK
ncbi:hypothetical protein [Psychroserpens luteolus]|uniref:hypothetical protein n=1 Tax=Psychroserpens luteolus TaxID=2855840 RepID=UPI001E29B588|nr:hypothetical protein [Psychroserpens luteolus]MCD2259773.1 hypothetical protein [Psychroserpens luteolus]